MARKHIRYAILVTTLVTAVAASAAAPEGEVLDRARREAITATAPEPTGLPANLKLRLVDYIDCADGADPHPFADDGTSSVTPSPMGPYRETAVSDNSFFAYRLA